MVMQSYHISAHPAMNDYDYKNPKMIQIYIWDAFKRTDDITHVSSKERIFHGVILPLEFLDLINDNFQDYKHAYLPNDRTFLYKIFPTHVDAWFDLFAGGYASIGMRYREYTAGEFSSNLKVILNQQILRDRNLLFALGWSFNQKNYLDVISRSIQYHFLDTRLPYT